MHPSFKPLLAVNMANETLLWLFEPTDYNVAEDKSVYILQAMTNLSFSQDGVYLIGMRSNTPTIFDLRRLSGTSKQSIEEGKLKSDTESIVGSSSLDWWGNSPLAALGIVDANASLRYRAPTMAPSSMSLTEGSNGQTTVTVLDFNSQSSAIHYNTYFEDGSMLQAEVSLLPKMSTLGKCSPMLIASIDPQVVRLVLNMAAQESYSASEQVNFQLPAILNRRIDSIPEANVISLRSLTSSSIPNRRRRRGDIRFTPFDFDEEWEASSTGRRTLAHTTSGQDKAKTLESLMATLGLTQFGNLEQSMETFGVHYE